MSSWSDVFCLLARIKRGERSGGVAGEGRKGLKLLLAAAGMTACCPPQSIHTLLRAVLVVLVSTPGASCVCVRQGVRSTQRARMLVMSYGNGGSSSWEGAWPGCAATVYFSVL